MSLTILLLLLSSINALKIYESKDALEFKTFYHRTSSFGPCCFNETAPLKLFDPIHACTSKKLAIPPAKQPNNPSSDIKLYKDYIVLILRGNCTFAEKVYHAQLLGAVGVIVGDNEDKNISHQWIIMSQDESTIERNNTKNNDRNEKNGNYIHIEIPSVFVKYRTYQWIELLLKAMTIKNSKSQGISANSEKYSEYYSYLNNGGHEIYAMLDSDGEYIQPSHPAWLASFGVMMIVIPAVWCLILVSAILRKKFRGWRDRRRRTDVFDTIPVIRYNGVSDTKKDGSIDDKFVGERNDNNIFSNAKSILPRFLTKSEEISGKPHNDNCCICLDDFVFGDKLKLLACFHAFHPKCIAPWLREQSDMCPICKRSIFIEDGTNVDNVVNGEWSIVNSSSAVDDVDIVNDNDRMDDEKVDDMIVDDYYKYSGSVETTVDAEQNEQLLFEIRNDSKY